MSIVVPSAKNNGFSRFSPQAFPGLYIWSDASAIAASSSGTSLSGIPNPGYLGLSSGSTPCTGVAYSNSKNGLTTVRINTSQVWTPSMANLTAYSLFWVGRQTGGTNRRVLSSNGSFNQLFGYWNGYKKGLYIDNSPGYIPGGYANTAGFTGGASDTAWDLMSHTRTAGGAWTFGWNGTPTYSGTTSSGNGTNFFINSGYTGETSDCEFGEIIIYDKALSPVQVQIVEGYLAYKWGLTSTFYIYNLYNLNPPWMRSFAYPTDIRDCLIWLDGADNSTITGTSPISAWANKGLNGGSAFVRVGSAQTGNSAGLNVNGLNFIRIPSGGSHLGFTTTLPSQARSWFWLARITGPINSSAYVYFVQATVYASDSAYFYYYNSYLNGFQLGPNAIDVNIEADIASSYTSNVTSLYAAVNSLTASSNVFTYNGVSQSLALSHGAYGNNTGNITYILGNGGVDFMEILFYSRAVTPFERQQIEGYLANKWGIARSSFQQSHPYYNFKPYIVPPFYANGGILSGLYAYYSFNNSVTDSIETTTLSTIGSISYSVGRNFGNAAYFSNNSQSSAGSNAVNYLSSTLLPTSNFTVATWYFPLNTTYGALFCSTSGSAFVSASVTIAISGGQTYGVYTNSRATSSASVGAGSWYHAAITYDGYNLAFYHNGTLIQTINSSGFTPYVSGFTIGQSAGAVVGFAFTGYMQDYRIYRRVLSSTEIANIYNGSG